jgi:prolyl-tRNA synthetase
MKDAYRFDVNKERSLEAYQKMFDAYVRIFNRLGLAWRSVVADTGSIGGNYSHEFHVLAETGEDDLLFDPDSDYAVNVEKYDPAEAPKPREQLEQRKGIEVGHCFHLGTLYSTPMSATVTLESGQDTPVVMGCYGIGVSRIVAAAIEQNHDGNGIIWPMALAPFQVGLVNLRQADDSCRATCEKIYEQLTAKGLDVLYDDRDVSAGAKFAEMDLIGLPWQCIIGPKGLAKGTAEWKNRRTGDTQELKLGQVPNLS